MNTRETVAQGIIFHDVLGKCIAGLDQIRKGLSVLGVRDVIEKNKELFKALFCYDQEQLCADALINRLEFDNEQIDTHKATHGFFTKFIKTADKKTLQSFCLYCTGCINLPFSASIKVKYEGDQGFYASTCLYVIRVPTTYSSYDQFHNAIKAVLCSGQSCFFSCIKYDFSFQG